ncbi:hypothetical protein H2241_16075 [Pantoea ananatis]|nr:hypothetical protein [Pantoea ananatis]MBA4822468.1 hypothetical protein [Pantoea ananatis]QKV87651.1 hypothetical protein FOB88_11170 [Pantoea ananatis]
MSDKSGKETDRNLAEFIRELAEQEGITFEEAQQLAIQVVRENVKALGQ